MTGKSRASFAGIFSPHYINMPCLSAAVVSQLASSSKDGTSATYKGRVDETWTIGSVPQGGVSLSIVTNAVQSFMRLDPQASSRHFDPLHISATYLVAVGCEDYNVEVKLQKRGKGLSQVSKAGVSQPRLAAQFIMTDFSSRKRIEGIPHLERGSPFFVECPITPPSQLERKRATWEEKITFADRLESVVDQPYLSKMKAQGKLGWATWMKLFGEDEPGLVPGGDAAKGRTTGNNLVPFFADMMENSVSQLPRTERGRGPFWYPTLHLAIEFKRALPYDRTLTRMGIVSSGKHIHHGQHEINCEVWSHPDDSYLLSRSGEASGKSELLCISRQLALTLPMSVNESRNAKGKL